MLLSSTADFISLCIAYREMSRADPGNTWLKKLDTETIEVKGSFADLWSASSMFSAQTRKILYPVVMPPRVSMKGGFTVTNPNGGLTLLDTLPVAFPETMELGGRSALEVLTENPCAINPRRLRKQFARIPMHVGQVVPPVTIEF